MTGKNNHKKDAPEANGPSSTPELNGFKQLLAYVEGTDLEFVQIEKGGRKFSFRRSAAACAEKAAAVPPRSENGGAAQAAAASQTLSIRSPIVGRFYRSTAADRPPLVVEGGLVSAGQRVAIVEAMKIRKDVISGVAGKISRILVRDGDPVEYGQELYSVEPEAEAPLE